MSSQKSFEDLQGLFDYADHNTIVGDLMSVTGLSRESVLEKLVAERFCIGTNVTADAKMMNIDAHVYNEKMDNFYRDTNAFVFELINVHQTEFCKSIDLKVLGYIVGLAGSDRSSKKILMLGDGIGSDSLRMNRLGFDATYFEFDGFSSKLARKRFERMGVSKTIRVIHDLGSIPKGEFDFVLCREVLEHVQDPPAVIANINSYLKDGGYAVITESFARVEPMFPTHLQSNLKYAGKTVDMFIETGFLFAGKIDEERPFVFRKTTASLDQRKASIPKRSVLDLAFRKTAFTLLGLSK